MRRRTSITGPKISVRQRSSETQVAAARKWAGSEVRRLSRSTACIAVDVGRWLGNCAQDRRPWLRKNRARGLAGRSAVTAQLVCAAVEMRDGNSWDEQEAHAK